MSNWQTEDYEAPAPPWEQPEAFEEPEQEPEPFTDYYCYYCPKCSSEYAGWGGVPEDFDPDNWCECPKEDS